MAAGFIAVMMTLSSCKKGDHDFQPSASGKADDSGNQHYHGIPGELDSASVVLYHH